MLPSRLRPHEMLAAQPTDENPGQEVGSPSPVGHPPLGEPWLALGGPLRRDQRRVRVLSNGPLVSGAVLLAPHKSAAMTSDDPRRSQAFVGTPGDEMPQILVQVFLKASRRR